MQRSTWENEMQSGHCHVLVSCLMMIITKYLKSEGSIYSDKAIFHFIEARHVIMV